MFISWAKVGILIWGFFLEASLKWASQNLRPQSSRGCGAIFFLTISNKGAKMTLDRLGQSTNRQ